MITSRYVLVLADSVVLKLTQVVCKRIALITCQFFRKRKREELASILQKYINDFFAFFYIYTYFFIFLDLMLHNILYCCNRCATIAICDFSTSEYNYTQVQFLVNLEREVGKKLCCNRKQYK
jgi:hypothetical protein